MLGEIVRDPRLRVYSTQSGPRTLRQYAQGTNGAVSGIDRE